MSGDSLIFNEGRTPFRIRFLVAQQVANVPVWFVQRLTLLNSSSLNTSQQVIKLSEVFLFFSKFAVFTAINML
jgi:hypothetical protein